jgi:hypothetical protein
MKSRFQWYMGNLSKFLPEHKKNLGRSYMVATPPKVKLKILKVTRAFYFGTKTSLKFQLLPAQIAISHQGHHFGKIATIGKLIYCY